MLLSEKHKADEAKQQENHQLWKGMSGWADCCLRSGKCKGNLIFILPKRVFCIFWEVFLLLFYKNGCIIELLSRSRTFHEKKVRGILCHIFIISIIIISEIISVIYSVIGKWKSWKSSKTGRSGDFSRVGHQKKWTKISKRGWNFKRMDEFSWK